MMLREPWRTRLLFLSFAVNLVTIPMAAARFFYHRPPMPPLPGGPPRPAVMFDRISHGLSSDDQAKLRAVVEPHFEEIDIARIRMEAAHGSMMRAMRQTPFDSEALKTAMRNWQGAWKGWSDSFGAAFFEGIQQVSPDGRQRLADADKRRPGR